jgi:DNA-binding NtrC family response regulator
MILLVDDDPFQAHLTMSLLGRQFGKVQRATDATEALCLVEQQTFADELQLVISGHHTKGFGGPAFVAELRDRMTALPVLVLGMKEESPDDYPGERVAFLAQPLISEQLVSLTHRILSLQKLHVA